MLILSPMIKKRKLSGKRCLRNKHEVTMSKILALIGDEIFLVIGYTK
ncbi:Hypothetical protein ADU73_0611 [Pediococcus damnosus]|nr:Hypothetical protein ADU73_0611 [Pediococcus damnosus]